MIYNLLLYFIIFRVFTAKTKTIIMLTYNWKHALWLISIQTINMLINICIISNLNAILESIQRSESKVFRHTKILVLKTSYLLLIIQVCRKYSIIWNFCWMIYISIIFYFSILFSSVYIYIYLYYNYLYYLVIFYNMVFFHKFYNTYITIFFITKSLIYFTIYL